MLVFMVIVVGVVTSVNCNHSLHDVHSTCYRKRNGNSNRDSDRNRSVIVDSNSIVDGIRPRSATANIMSKCGISW